MRRRHKREEPLRTPLFRHISVRDPRRRDPLHVLVDEMIPKGQPQEVISEWLNNGLDVEIYMRMHGVESDDPPGTWMIRVGNRELSVEEYLLLFDEEH